MSVLVDWQIKELIAAGDIKITPYDEKLVNPASLDIRLGKTFGKVYWIAGYLGIDPSDPNTFETTYLEHEYYVLKPNEFILASMYERVDLPYNVIATLRGKSSLGRLGLVNSSMAGFVDNKWEGVLTMELHNVSENNILLKYGMKIGQLVFERTEIPEKHYGQTGRYSNQRDSQGSLGV